MIQPFQNNSESLQIGNLIIENQTEKVSIYGDIDILNTEQGLAQAMQLHALTSALVAQLKVDKSNFSMQNQQDTDKVKNATQCTIDNPFL